MRAEARAAWRCRSEGARVRAAAPRLTMPEAALLARRLELLGLPRPARIRVNDNRAVIVSLSARGVLSIHRGYALAPERALKAVVRFLKPHVSRASPNA